MKNRPVLGRGLDAIFNANQGRQEEPERFQQAAGQPPLQKSGEQSSVSKLPTSQIEPNPYQPRRHFDQAAMDELKKSIVANGLIQPVTVRRFGRDRYQLISGERRFKACTEIGYREIPAYILEQVDDETMLALALIENVQREDLNPIEIALAYKQLMDECSLTQEQIAERIGKDRTTIANFVRLLKLPGEIQECLIGGSISMGHARALISVPNAAFQLLMLKKILSEGLSVRAVEKLVKKAEKESAHARTKIRSSHFQSDASLQSIEDDLRRILGTKVLCKQNKDGKGEIVIEFYSIDEFERILEILHERR